MPLGMEICLGSGDIVLDGAQLPRRKGHSSLHFSALFALARSSISATASAELLFWLMFGKK